MDKIKSKSLLRQEYIRRRKLLKRSEILEKSFEISKKVVKIPQILGANNVLTYLPVNQEVENREIIDFLITFGKTLYVPAYLDNQWGLAKFTSWDNLEAGPFGILQPSHISIPEVEQTSIEAAILPGVAFDLRGVRLGYGKGVFDKLLSKSNTIKIGLCFDFQIVDKLPKEKHDLVMDYVVSERRLVKI